MYAVVDTEIVPFFDTGLRTGVWRSRKFTIPRHPPFSWLRINGPGTPTCTVRIYNDGSLWHTAVVTGRTPIRLPAGVGKIWEIEVEGTGRVTSAAIATSSKELV